MKSMLKRLLAFVLVLMLISADIAAVAEGLGKFILPSALKVIEAEAFLGNAAIEEVVVPEGAEEIGERAFADSSIKEITLPESIEYIADDAFEDSQLQTVTAEKGTYAYNWAVNNGYIQAEGNVDPLAPVITSCTLENGTGIHIEWEGHEDTVDGEYMVEYSTNAFQDENYFYLFVYEPQCTIYGLQPNTTYYLRIVAFTEEDYSECTSQIFTQKTTSATRNIPITRLSIWDETEDVYFGNGMLGEKDPYPRQYIEIEPANASNQQLKWVSSNPEIASVDENTGIITCHAFGTTRLTATTTDGSGISLTGDYDVAPPEPENFDSTVNGTTVTVSWSSAPGADHYWLLCEDGNTGELHTEIDCFGFEYTFTNLKPNHGYIIYIISGVYTDEGNAIYGSSRPHYIITGGSSAEGADPSAPIITSCWIDNGTNIFIKWTCSLGENFDYRIEYSTDNFQTDEYFEYDTFSFDFGNTDDLYGLKPNTTYYIRIVAEDDSSKYISSVCTRTTTTPKENIPITEFSFWAVDENGCVGCGDIGTRDIKIRSHICLEPYNASNQQLKWTSSNPSVASVTEDTGIIVAHSYGLATLTASTTDGSNLSISGDYYVVPDGPEDVNIIESGTNIIISWNAVKGAECYQVICASSSEEELYTVSLDSTELEYVFTNLEPSTFYYFTVCSGIRIDTQKAIYGNGKSHLGCTGAANTIAITANFIDPDTNEPLEELDGMLQLRLEGSGGNGTWHIMRDSSNPIWLSVSQDQLTDESRLTYIRKNGDWVSIPVSLDNSFQIALGDLVLTKFDPQKPYVISHKEKNSDGTLTITINTKGLDEVNTDFHLEVRNDGWDEIAVQNVTREENTISFTADASQISTFSIRVYATNEYGAITDYSYFYDEYLSNTGLGDIRFNLHIPEDHFYFNIDNPINDVTFEEQTLTVLSGRVLDENNRAVEGAQVRIVPVSRTNASSASAYSNDATTVMTETDGSWSWDRAVLNETYSISFAKESMTFDTVLTVTADSEWGVVTEPVRGIGPGYTVNAANTTIGGTITTENGTTVRGVPVTLANAEGTEIARTLTDDRGVWSFIVPAEDAEYTVSYAQNLMPVEPASETVVMTGGVPVALTALAQAIEQIASDLVTFTMESNSIIVGRAATFHISVPADVTKARMVADGVPYDIIYPENGSCTFIRDFTKSGQRSIAFQIAQNGEWGAISAAQTLDVISDGQLEKPVYEDITTHYAGSDLLVDWQDVPKAEQYVVRVYYGGVEVAPPMKTDESYAVISGKNFPFAGQYSVSVMATGIGYSQSASDDLFDVVLRDYKLNMSSPKNKDAYVVNDQIDINLTQSGGGYVAVKVVEPSGRVTWYPQNENGVVLSAEEALWIPVATREVGSHTITPYLFTVPELTEGIEPALTGTTVKVAVNGPDIRGVYPGGDDFTWIYEASANQMRVTTNNAVETIEVYEDGNLLFSTGGDVYTENPVTYVRTFNLTLASALSKGEHTLTVKATDADSATAVTSTKTFYVVQSVANGATVYPQAAEIELHSSPMNGKMVDKAYGGSTINALTIVGDASSWYQVSLERGDSSVTGFVPYTQVGTVAWSGASGKIVIQSPTDAAKLPKVANKTLNIEWQTGLIVPDDAVYQVTIDGLVSDTYIQKQTTGNEVAIPFSELEVDEYMLSVQMLEAGQATAKSDTVSFTIGDFSLEDSYREWWLNYMADSYSAYLQKGEPFSDSVSVFYGWGGFVDTEIQAGVRPKIIFEPATLAYTQILQDFKDLKKDSKTNAENNYALVSIDEEAMRRTMLLSISQAMLDETEKGNLVLKKDLSNVDKIAESNQTITIKNAETNAGFATIDILLSGIETAIFSSALYKGTPASESITDFLAVVKECVLAIKNAVIEAQSEKDALHLLSIYADRYVFMLENACDGYVSCLEDTYRQDDWGIKGTYSYYVQEYIDAFNKKKSSHSELYDEAFVQILGNTGYTPEMINDAHTAVQAEFAKVLSEDFIWMLMIDLINEQVGETYQDIMGPSADDVKLFEYDSTTNQVSFNPEDLIVALGEDAIDSFIKSVAQRMIKSEYKKSIKNNIVQALNNDLRISADHVSIAETFMKAELADVKNREGIFKSLLGLVHSSWDLGIALDELGTATSTINDQHNNKGYFDTYGLRLITTMKLRIDAANAGGLVDYNWDEIDATDISEWNVQKLDDFTQALITLTNYDSSIMLNYRAMKTINESNGNKFDYDLDWLTLDEIDRRRNLIDQYRNIFSFRPAIYDPLFE